MIYLDHHAVSIPHPEVLRAMEEARVHTWANPASAHRLGRESRRHLETARTRVARAIGGSEAEIVFTATGSEACRLGIHGMLGIKRIWMAPLEHPAMSGAITTSGLPHQTLPLAPLLRGELPPAVGEGDLLAINWANHEIGTVFPIEALARAAKERGTRVFVDGIQALGRLPIRLDTVPIDAMAIAGQKFGGPTGAAALFIRRSTPYDSPDSGGGEERGRRPGTPDVERIHNFDVAATLLEERLAQSARGGRIARLRDRLEEALIELGGVVNGRETERIATVTNVSFLGRRGPILVAALDLEGVAASFGAACSSGVDEPSKNLLALYPGETDRAHSAVRFSLGPETTEDDIDGAVRAMRSILSRRGPLRAP